MNNFNLKVEALSKDDLDPVLEFMLELARGCFCFLTRSVIHVSHLGVKIYHFQENLDHLKRILLMVSKIVHYLFRVKIGVESQKNPH